VALAGGVACNQRLRQQIRVIAERRAMTVFYPPLSLCTDNAAMIAAAGHFHLSKGHYSDQALNAHPTLSLTPV
jgi:N6-L-threonylcarbamoyladenine synthase